MDRGHALPKAAKILVVDDDRMAMVLLQHLLMDLGYDAEATNSGTEALARLDSEPDRFDVVITNKDLELATVTYFLTVRAKIERLSLLTRYGLAPRTSRSHHKVD